MISFIVPYTPNRYDLFLENLNSLEDQTNKDFEVVVVCQNTSDDFSKLNTSFDIKNIWITTDGQNPAYAQNVGVKHADGDILVLTSPEVINARTNVSEMSTLPQNTFWLGRVVEEKWEMLENGNYEYNYISNVKCIPGRIMADCTKDNWASWKYFLGVIHKEDYQKIGGMDEEFMKGIAWEDRDFADRVKEAGIVSEFNDKIAGIHLWHPRSYQDNNEKLRMKNREYYASKRKVFA